MGKSSDRLYPGERKRDDCREERTHRPRSRKGTTPLVLYTVSKEAVDQPQVKVVSAWSDQLLDCPNAVIV